MRDENENLIPTSEEFQIQDLLKAAPLVFDICAEIEDPAELANLKLNEQPKHGGYLLYGNRDSEGYFVSKGYIFLGELQPHQVGSKTSESRYITYWRAVFSKCCEKAGRYCEFPDFNYLKPVPLGCAEDQGS